MSDIKEKIVEIIKEGISFSPQVGTYVIHGAIDGILTLIESNYIPKEEHENMEEQLNKSDILLGACRTANESCFSEIQKLKEENERLKFMIENGLGWKDMENDIKYPTEV